MENRNAEKERKELNKKLLKSTSKKEIKQYKLRLGDIIVNGIAIFLGLYLADVIVPLLPIDLQIVDMVIEVAIITVFLSLASWIMRKMR